MKKMSKREYGEYLRKARERLGFSRNQMSTALGLTAHTIKQVELGFQNLGMPAKLMVERLLEEKLSGIAEAKRGKHRPSSGMSTEAIAEHLAHAFSAGDLRGKVAEIAKTLCCSEKQAMKAALMVELERIGGHDK